MSWCAISCMHFATAGRPATKFDMDRQDTRSPSCWPRGARRNLRSVFDENTHERRWLMTGISPHRVWVEQCEACATIRTRYGRRSAFDYLVVEKLTNFAEAAMRYPDFARELPAFVAEVRAALRAPGTPR